MRIASTAKAYSGGVALSLVEEGVMSLDDTVGELLPWTNPDWHAVTLAQALHHTSGIPDVLDSSAFIDAVHRQPSRRPVAAEAVELSSGMKTCASRRTVPTSTPTPTTSWSG